MWQTRQRRILQESLSQRLLDRTSSGSKAKKVRFGNREEWMGVEELLANKIRDMEEILAKARSDR